MKNSTKLKKVKIVEAKRIVITDYNQIDFCLQNRPTNPNHVKRMTKSVLKHGVLRDIIIVWNMLLQKYLVADGQHLKLALQGLNRPLECRVVECENDSDLTQLMIDLNNTSKSWKLPDYIHGWAQSGNRDYQLIQKEAETSGIQISVFIMAYTLKRRTIATNMVKEGSFKIGDKKLGDKLIHNLKDYQNYLPNKREYNESLMQLMISYSEYNHKQMMKNLKIAMKYVSFTTKESEIYAQLEKIYKGE